MSAPAGVRRFATEAAKENAKGAGREAARGGVEAAAKEAPGQLSNALNAMKVLGQPRSSLCDACSCTSNVVHASCRTTPAANAAEMRLCSIELGCAEPLLTETWVAVAVGMSVPTAGDPKRPMGVQDVILGKGTVVVVAGGLFVGVNYVASDYIQQYYKDQAQEPSHLPPPPPFLRCLSVCLSRPRVAALAADLQDAGGGLCAADDGGRGGPVAAGGAAPQAAAAASPGVCWPEREARNWLCGADVGAHL